MCLRKLEEWEGELSSNAECWICSGEDHAQRDRGICGMHILQFPWHVSESHRESGCRHTRAEVSLFASLNSASSVPCACAGLVSGLEVLAGGDTRSTPRADRRGPKGAPTPSVKHLLLPKTLGRMPETSTLELESGRAAQEAAALDLKVARRMFYGGFAGLPFLWFVAWVHFRSIAKLPTADPQLQTYVNRSLIGAIVGGLGFVAWVITVQTSWRSWGAFGQSIMLVIPEAVDEL